MFDPLTQYHAFLRTTQASGYPNVNYQMPHPYEMAYSQVGFNRRMNKAPFRLGYGRNMRVWPQQKYNQGIGRQRRRPSGYHLPDYNQVPTMGR